MTSDPLPRTLALRDLADLTRQSNLIARALFEARSAAVLRLPHDPTPHEGVYVVDPIEDAT